MSVMDIGPVAFGGMEKMISFLRSQHVLARSCDCNRVNFFRTGRIILDDVPIVLRATFLDLWNSSHGVKWQHSNGKKLRKKLEEKLDLNSTLQKLLDAGDPEKWDASLLCLVLLNDLWRSNTVSCRKIRAITDIRDIRNNFFAHHHEAGTSKIDLTRIINLIEKAYNVLLDGKPNKVQSIKRLRDIETEEIVDGRFIQRFLKCQIEQEQLKQTVEILEPKVQVQEKKSYDHDQRISNLESDILSIQEQVMKDGEQVTGLKQQVSLLTLTQSDSEASPSPPQASSKNSNKHHLKKKKVYATDSDLDSGHSTAAETFEIPGAIQSDTRPERNVHTPPFLQSFPISGGQNRYVPSHHFEDEEDPYQQLNNEVKPKEESHTERSPRSIAVTSSNDSSAEKVFAGGEGNVQKKYFDEEQVQLYREKIAKLSEEKQQLEEKLKAANEAASQEVHDLQEKISNLKDRLTCVEKEKEELKHQLQERSHKLENDGLNHFALLQCESLGSGSFGVVYRYTDTKGNTFAAKAFHRPYDRNKDRPYDRNGDREFSIYLQLKHDNIVCYMGIHNCFPGKRPILLMELMSTNLHDYINLNPDLSKKLRIALNCFCGLRYLHSYYPVIIHRDISARNVLLNESGVAKIADFGNARFLKPDQQSNMTRDCGRATYVAPELQSGHYTEKVDIFSCGHLMLFLFINQFPCDLKPALSLTKKGERVYCDEVERRSYYIKILEQICVKSKLQTVLESVKACLSLDIEQRPSASELIDQFHPLLKQIALLSE